VKRKQPARPDAQRPFPRRVIITGGAGAAGGIGGAAAAELRRQGARVVGLDVHADGDDVIECDIRDQERWTTPSRRRSSSWVAASTC